MSPTNPLPPALPPGAPAAPAPGKKALNGCLIAAIIGALLLIGILLIAMLAGIALPVLNSARKKAQHRQARVLATSILNSCKGYYAEYSKYPLPGDGAASEVSPLRTDEVLTAILLGTDIDRNPKKIMFLPELKPVGRGGGFGLLTEGDMAMVVDPWGEEFYVLMDADYSGTIPNPDPRPDRPPVLHQGVLVYSAGPDKDPATWEDNPTSWVNGPVSPGSPAAPPPTSSPLPPPAPPSPGPPPR